MLTFKNTTVFFLLLVLGTAVLQRFWPVSWMIFLVLGAVWSGLLVYGCMTISSGFFLPVYCKGEPSVKQMALTFDDGPDAALTPLILQILAEEKCKAAFFCIGKNIRGKEDLLRKIDREGHLLGNHSYSHNFWFDLYSSGKMAEDLVRMDQQVSEVLGKKPLFFRPPYGVTNPNVRKAIVRGQYTPVGWSIRSLDTVARDADKLSEKVTNAFHPGAILLFHDTCTITGKILSGIIREGRRQGYEWVRVDELLKQKAYA